MSALSIQPTFPIFTDTDGSPLENGYIWIGTVNLPAQTNPIAVYWDAALTITATQPIRTQGGYPSRNGSTARLYVNSDYSILVQNKNGSMVYSAPAATERIASSLITGLNASQVVYDPAGSGAVPTTVQAKLRETVSVKDFGAVGDGVTDDTAAFNAAQAASDRVYVPVGNYGLVSFKPKSRLNLIAEAQGTTYIEQLDPAQPAIAVTSDVSTGQLFDQNICIRVRGHASATVEAVLFQALSPYAITRGTYNLLVTRCYQAVRFNTSGSNVFRNYFKIVADETTTTALALLGGTYNDFDVFVTNPGNGRAVETTGFNNTFLRCVTEGQIWDQGQINTYIAPAIEELPNTPPTAFAIQLLGFGTTLVNPSIVLGATSSTKVTTCIQPCSFCTIINPQLLVNGVANPFGPANGPSIWNLVGPGRNNCTNKMEVTYDGTTTERDMRRVGLSNQCSQFSSGTSSTAGKTTQYVAPTTSTSITVLNATDALIIEPTGTIPTITFALGPAGTSRREGQTLSVYTSQAITTASWDGRGSDASAFPTSFSAGQIFRAVYNLTANKWYPC